MAAMAHAAHALSEAALWPLLAQNGMTLQEIGKFLEASRGSVPSSPSAFFAARTSQAFIVLACTVTITLAPFSSAPLVGYVYERQNMTVSFQSSYQPGGGIGQSYKQTNPPLSIRTNATSFYTAWASGLAPEPLPSYRNWFLDRTILADRGSMSVIGVKINHNIQCRSWQPPRPRSSSLNGSFVFATKMKDRDQRHDKDIKVKGMPRLGVWVHDYQFMSTSRIKTTLAFAALNGTIAGGTMVEKVPEGVKDIVNISTVACDVDLELVNDHLTIGHPGQTAPVKINSLEKIRRRPKKPEETLNELALWFSVAPVTNGASVAGAQPMYSYHKDGLPVSFTTTGRGGRNDEWTIEYIENFIEGSLGASALGDSSNWKNGTPVEFTSLKNSVKLDPSRPMLLLVPPLAILLCAIVLVCCNVRMHSQMKLPIMRLATLSEILKSAQTEELRRTALNDMQISNRPSRLGNVAVEFRDTSNGLWGLNGLNHHQGLLDERESDYTPSKHTY